ncbi:hypothetical protein NL676_000013 [Syzygium grande]|nr:hypothetical protein NL676_000013 [Syzygium grande]
MFRCDDAGSDWGGSHSGSLAVEVPVVEKFLPCFHVGAFEDLWTHGLGYGVVDALISLRKRGVGSDRICQTLSRALESVHFGGVMRSGWADLGMLDADIYSGRGSADGNLLCALRPPE